MNFVKPKVLRFGTFNGADGTIIHVNPDSDQVEVSSPTMTLADAKIGFERGLLDDPEKAPTTDEAPDAPLDANSLNTFIAAETEKFASEDEKGGTGSGTLDSRQSTAWPDRERVTGPAEGYTDGVRVDADLDTASGDDDAPPVPKRGTGRTTKAAG